MEWIFLAGAIIFEVIGTLCMRMGAHGSSKWYIGLVIGYLLAFASLSMALSEGMGLGVAYGIWSATGVALTAVLSKVLFDEPLTWLMTAGIAIVVGGVLLVEMGAASAGEQSAASDLVPDQQVLNSVVMTM